MPIPYEIKKFSIGKLILFSHLFFHPNIHKHTIEEYFLKFEGIKRAKCIKRKGLLNLEYDPEKFDLIDLINFFKKGSYEIILEEISKQKITQPQERKENRWILYTTLGFIPYFFRSVLPNPLLSGVTFLLSFPVFKKALNALHQKRLDVHCLDSIAILSSLLSKNSLPSHIMIFLLSLGDYLEDKIEQKAYKDLESLFGCNENYAWVIVGEGQSKRIKASELQKGDLIAIYAGEKITADGRVVEGSALVNQASLTGESNPVLKKQGDKVYAGTFVEDGKLYVKVEEVGSETVLAKVISVIESCVKEPISLQKRGEELANKFVIPTLLLGTSSFLLTGQSKRFTSTLTIDYYSGIHLSSPLCIMSHIAEAAKHGILIKCGSKLEALHKIDTIVMDKTGTLTIGVPQIMDLIGINCSEEEVLLYGASLEQKIMHPVARALVKLSQERGIELLPRENSKYHIGLGIEGNLMGEPFLLGSTMFMMKKRIKIPPEIRELVDKLHTEAKSVLYLVKKRQIIGLITFADPLREEAYEVVRELRKRGKEIILCTGDNEGVAKYIAKKLGINRYYARSFPEEKVKVIKSLKEEGKVVAFVGDGVNDSPALTAADVGISLRGATEIAIELADVVIGDNLNQLVWLINLADKALNKITRLYNINILVNTTGLIGSAIGIFNPAFSTLINNGLAIFLGLSALKK